MPYISDIELTAIKSTICIKSLVEHSGIELKPHGKDWIGHCPFHDDKTPSLVISVDKNLWHCLGACGEGGDVIAWVMKHEGLSFREAAAQLQSQVLLDSPRLSESVNANSSLVANHSNQAIDSVLVEHQDLLQQVIDIYHEHLLSDETALAYLESRGLASMELIKHFKLGVAPGDLSRHFPSRRSAEGREILTGLKALGVVRESGLEHFKGCLIIPIINDDQVLNVYGRRMGEARQYRPGTPMHLYLPGPHCGVFNRDLMVKESEVILCEALIDALTLWDCGFTNVTCSYGVTGFTADHLAAFKADGVERVIIAYDADEAGDSAANQLAMRLQEIEIGCYRAQLPKGMDINSYALKVQPASKSLGLVLSHAQWLGEGEAPVLKSISDERNITDALAEGLDIPIEAVEPAPADDTDPIDLNLAAESLLADSAEMAETVNQAQVDVNDHDVVLRFSDRDYRVRGLSANTNEAVLKVNIRVSSTQQPDGQINYYLDTLDLYQSRGRHQFIEQVAKELLVTPALIKSELGQVLFKLEALQADQLSTTTAESDEPVISDAQRQAALDLLQDRDLLNRIVTEVEQLGLVGERENVLVSYLGCVSRLLKTPLAVLVQSSSSAGKSTLMDKVLSLMPETEKVHYSAMTGQSLFYMGELELKHKILSVAEEEGASQAGYALKLLQSDGELSIASTGKDEKTGNLVTQRYHVEGPVMLFLTTTAMELDEELMNRCVVLSVNESRGQTKAIHQLQRQRRTLSGLLQSATQTQLIDMHQVAQRLLQPLKVVNPYADQLTFMSTTTRSRRDHEKYLTLIDTIALLHQYQREVKELICGDEVIEYIEVALSDIEAANQLAHAVLGRSLDELAPQTRRLLGLIKQMVDVQCRSLSLPRGDIRFSRKDIRKHSGWSDGQLKIHCARLSELEYLLIHKGGRGQSYDYELLYDGEVESDHAHAMGLIEPAQLAPSKAIEDAASAANRSGVNRKTSGLNDQTAVPSQAQVSPKSQASQGPQIDLNPLPDKGYRENGSLLAENAYL